MSNKEKIKETFNEKFSTDKNYQSIMKKINKKENKRKYYLNWSLAPILVAILLIIGFPLMLNGNEDIYINKLQETITPRAIFNLYQSKEYDVAKEYPFVSDVLIPSDLNKKEEGITFTSDELEAHDYIIAYYNDDSSRSVKVSFTKKGVESFTESKINIKYMKTSKISSREVVIAEYENDYYVKLEYKDLIFNIETNNIELNELINVVESILK